MSRCVAPFELVQLYEPYTYFVEGIQVDVAVIPLSEDEVNAGGSYVYAGTFKHDLKKVWKWIFS